MTWTVYAIPPGKDRRSWRLEARPPGGRGKSLWKRAETETEATAQERAQLWQEELRALVLGNDPTVGDVLACHIAHRERDGHTKAGTLESYQMAHRRIARLELAALRSAALTRAVLLHAQDELRRLMKPQVVNLTMAKAKTAWTWANERGLVKTPWPAVKRLKPLPTIKRPFRDGEVVAVLEWLAASKPTWLSFFAVLADSGARPGELLSIDGRDVDRARCELVLRVQGERDTKTHEPRIVAVSAETMELVPQARPDQPVFRGQRSPRLSIHTVLFRLHRAVKAIPSIKDPERLDVTSFGRRGFVASAHRAGVPPDVARRQTGHKTLAAHMVYTRNAEGDDLHEVVALVRSRRPATGRSRQEDSGCQVESPQEPQRFLSDSHGVPSGPPGRPKRRKARQEPESSASHEGVLLRLSAVLPKDPRGDEVARFVVAHQAILREIICTPRLAPVHAWLSTCAEQSSRLAE